MTSLPRALFVSSTLLLVACPSADTGTKDDDTQAGSDRETGRVDDTSETGDTGDSTAIDTSDTGVVDTGDTGEVVPGLASLAAFPRAMVVNPGATYQVTVLATETSGDEHPYVGAAFTSMDEAVATVDASGLVTAVAAGATRVVVSAEGVETGIEVEVRADLVATVTVVNGSTGAPVEGATVRSASGDFTTDAAGVANVTVADAGAITLTAWVDEDHHAVSLVGTVGRQFTIPLDPLADDEPTAEIHGEVDFGNVPDAEAGQMVMGLACATVQGAFGMLDIEDLLAENRSISVYGVDVDVPSNLFAEGYADDFYALAWPGTVGVWGLSGPIDIGEVTAGLNGTGDALALLVSHLDDMVWGKRLGLTAVAGATTETDFAPEVEFDDTLNAALPTLPAGFDGTEQMFLMSADEVSGEGWVVTGLGMGAGVAEVQRVAPGTLAGATRSAVYAYAQVGGLGSGGGASVAVGADDGGLVTFPDMLDVPVVDLWDAGTRSLTITVDPDASITRASLIDDKGRTHDVYVNGSWSGEVDKSIEEFQRGKASVRVEVYGGVRGNFEHWLSQSTFEPDNHEPDTRASVTQAKE